MKKPIRILIVEDKPDDADLARSEIRKTLNDCEFEIVETREDFTESLKTFQPDVILSDYVLPHFDGMKALELSLHHAPWTPLIIWTGAIREDVAVDCVKAGANNYILKDNLKRLGPAILRALEERELLVARKRAEEELQNNEKRFRALIENGLADISLLAADGTLLWESPSTIRNLGYAPGEFVGRNIFELMHPDDLAWTRDTYAKLLKQPGERQRGSFRLRRADGTWRWVEAIATNMLHEPSVCAMVINYHDVTEQKQAQIELQQRNTDLALVNALNEAINQGQDLYMVMNLLRDEVKRNFSGEYTNIYLLNPDGQSIKMHEYSLPAEVTKKIEKLIGRTIPPIELLVQEDSIFQDVLRSGQSVVVSDPETIRKWIGEFVEIAALPPIAKAAIRKLLPQIYKLLDIKSTILVPLISDGKTLGVLSISGSNIFTERDVKRFEHICGQLTTALRRKQVEDDLRESQARYQNLVETSHDLIWSVDAEGRFTFVNRAAREIYGYEPEELIGRSFFEVLDPEHYRADMKIFKETLANADEFREFETYVRHRDGRQIILSANSIVLRDEQGNITGVTGSSHDITVRKRVEDVLKEERNLLRTLIDNIPDRIYAMDVQGRKTLSNIADWKACGVKTMEDVIGKTDFDLYPPVLAEEFWELDKEVLHSGQPVINYEEPGLDAEGNFVSILTSKIPLRDDNGNVIGLVGIGRDITERKQVEARINDLLAFNEKILNHSSVGIITYKLTGECVYANEHAATIVGATVEQLKARNFHTLESWKTSGLYDLVLKASRTQAPVTADIHMHTSYGKEVWMTVNCVTFRLKEEDHVLLSAIDITERKQTEERLRRSENQYRLATKATNDVIWEWDPKTHQLLWSENARHVFGYPEAEIGLNEKWWDDHIHPDDRARVLTKLDTLISGSDSIWLEEYRFRLKDGSYAHISDRGYVERDETGVPIRMIGAMSDITSRKEAEIERQALLEIMQGFANTKDLQELLKLIHDSIAKVIYAENFFVVLYQEKNGLFEEIYSVDQYDLPEPPSKLENSITSYVFRTGEPLLLTQTSFEELAARGEVQLVGTDSASWLGVPLKTSSQTIGVMAVQDYENDNRYSDHDKDFLSSIATQVALVIEHRRAGEALRESEEHYRTIFEGVQDAIFVESLDGKVLMVNERACEMFGYSQADFLTKTVADLIPPGHPILMADGEVTSLSTEPRETFNQRANGEVFPIEISGRVQIINGEKVLLVVVRDITERKRAEEALRETEAKYRTLVEQLPAVTYMDIADESVESGEFNTTYISPQVEGLLGYAPDAFYSDHGLWTRLLHPADRERVLTGNSAYYQTQGAYRDEYRMMTRAGKEIWVRDEAMIVRARKDKPAFSQGVLFDITERKRVEEELQHSTSLLHATLESTADGILVVQPDGSITNLNRKFLELWQIPDHLAQQMNDRSMLEFVVNQLKDPSAFISGVEALYQSPEVTSFGELEFLDGRIFERYSQPQRLGNTVVGRVWSFRDVTERKRAEAAEREQRVLAQALRDTAETLSSTLDYGEVLDHILTAVGLVVPHDAASILLIEQDVARVVRSQGHDKHGLSAETMMDIRLSLAETTNLRTMLETKQSVVVYDTFSYPGWKRTPTTDWLRSNVSTPISIYGEIIGFICLDGQEAEFFTPVHAERLEAFANQAAIAIHNARLLQQAQNEIAERKRAEESLREERKKAEKYLEIAGVMMLALDREGNVALMNQKGCEILGYSADEIIGKNWIDTFLPEATREELRHVFQNLVSDDIHSLEYYENSILTKNGEERLIAWHNTLLRDEQGRIISILSSGEDITERKQVETALRESVTQFRTLFEASPDAIVLIDPNQDWSIVDCNTVACQMNGYAREELLGQSVDILNLTPGNPNERKEYMERVQEYGILHYETLHRRKDGTVFTVDVSTSLIKFGTRDLILGIDRDVTERKLAEEEIHRRAEETSALLQTSLALTSLDLESTLQTVGNSANRLFLADGCRIFLLEPDGETLRCALALGENTDAFLNLRIKIGQGVTGAVAASGRAEIINDMQNDPRAIQVAGTEEEQEAIMFAPLRERDRVIGILSIRRVGREHPFQDAELELLEAFASMTASAVSNARLFEETQQRLAELNASEERFRQLADNIQEVFWMTDAETGRELYMSPAVETIWGRPIQSLMYEPDAFMTSVFSEDRPMVMSNIEKEKNGEKVQLEYRIVRPDGSLRWIWDRAFPIYNDEGRVKIIAGISADITERKQHEHQLRKLSSAVEHSGSTIVITDTAGNIEYVNRKFTQTTGYSFEEVIGHNPRILKSGFTPEEDYKELWQTISQGHEWHGELLNRKKNGTLFWESVTISPILNDRREITHFVGIKEDITERKQSEFEIQRHIAELEAVYENGLSVGRLLEPREIGYRVIETFSLYLSWHHVTIRLRKEGSDDLELVAFSLPDLKEEEKAAVEQHYVTFISKVGQGLSGWVLETGMPFRTGNVHAHPQYVDTHAGIQSGLYMPLKVGDRIIGVISVESEAPDAFTEQDQRLLATLANQTAIAFENARLYEAMQKELSERKRVEDALRVSETHYRALADSITDILFELDQNLHYTHWNKASETLIGVSAQDVIGKSMEEILGATEEQARIRAIYEQVLRNHQPRTFEATMIVGGEQRSFEVNAYPSMRGVSVVAKDVTDRKRTEAIMQKRFELMEYSAKHSLKELMQRTVDEVSELTGSTIGFFHFMEDDQNHLGMQTWSTNALQLFQVSPEDGAHLPLDHAGVWAEAVRQRRPLIQNDYASLTQKKGIPQGHVPIVREIIIPIIRSERTMAVMGIGNKPQDYTAHDLDVAARLADYAWDVTERKLMEIALEVERNQLVQRVEERTADLSRANSNLARALRVKDEFLANMSHELRTPLNAILGLSESLGEQIAGPLNEKQQKYISTISESGHHLLSLINDILDLAKIDAGQITLDINKVDIHSVCQASLRMIKQLAQKKNQEVSLEIDNGLGLMWADERRLKQMIVNLLGNAVKFTPECGKLGLEVRGDEDANQIAITVWDNGIGIKNEDLARLFQPFVQLDSGLAREATGTGLGLALVAQMARLHGGSVSAVSEAGKGSRFTIILPWEPALAIDTASRMKITGKFRALKFDEKNKPTILLVEDTKEVVMIVKDYLELAGYRVFTAQDGIDGIVQARHVRPDLILMDVQMPRMDGFETTRKLRSDPHFRYTPIIALTALAMPHDRERCLEAGMDEYISKPVNLKALVKIIQGCLFEQESRTR